MATEKTNGRQTPQHNSTNAGSSLALLRAVYDSSPDMILIYGPKGKLLDMNGNALQQFQFTKSQFLSAPREQYLTQEKTSPDTQYLSSEAKLNARLLGREWIARRKDGTEFPVEVRIQSLPNNVHVHGVPAVSMFTVRDISHRKAYESKILHLAHYDALTGLINRTLIEDRARQAISRCKRNQSKMAFLFMDLDFFKQINDQFGHRSGDLLLKAVAARVQSTLRDNDTFGRLGGDEFLLLAEEIGFTDDAMFIAEKVIKTLGEPFGIDGHVISITPSIGISLFPDHGETLSTLMQNADKAMYRAKDLGRNKLAVYNPKLYSSATD